MNRTLTEELCYAVIAFGVVGGALAVGGLGEAAELVGSVAGGVFLASVWAWVRESL